MSGQVLVTLLITIVLLNIVQIVATHNDGAFHLGAHDNAAEDTSTDGDVAGEGALLVDIGASNGLLRGLKAQAYILIPAGALTLGDDTLVVEEYGLLFLEAALMLNQNGWALVRTFKTATERDELYLLGHSEKVREPWSRGPRHQIVG